MNHRLHHHFNRRRALFNRDVLTQDAHPDPVNFPVLNRDFRKPSDGWYHIAPTGEYPHPETGLTQLLDDTAMQAIVNRFNEDAQRPNFGGVLVDFDHFSYDPDKSSAAAGWITRLENRPDGLWAQVRWTEGGEHALANGTYRFISPVWLRHDTVPAGPGRIRPLRLDSAGLTNSPNLKGMVPLSNRRAELAPSPEKPKENMKLIATLVGLAAEASEDAICAEITRIKNRATAAEEALTASTQAGAPLKNRITDLESQLQTLTESVVEADLNQYAHCFKPEARDKWKTQLIANRAGALELLDSLAEPATPDGSGPPVLNRAGAKTPVPAKDFPALVTDCMTTQKCTKSQAVDVIMTNHPEAHREWLKNGGGAL